MKKATNHLYNDVSSNRMIVIDVDAAMADPRRSHIVTSGFSGIVPRYSCIRQTSEYILSNHRVERPEVSRDRHSPVVVSDLPFQDG